jgi:23S rRNA pseudouridine1911/1915/1917 synthase
MPDQANVRADRTWIVPQERSQLRLDAFARDCLPHLSRRQVEAAIRTGLFFVGGKPSKKGDRLQAGDELRFCGPDSWLIASPLPNPAIAPVVIYEDDVILAIDKPAGIPTHGFSGRDSDTLANLLLARWPELAKVGKSRWEPGMVHRLDRDTSGVLLIAKTQRAFEHLRSQFRRRTVSKVYSALVHGKTPSAGLIDTPLVHDRRDPRRMRAVGKTARSKERAWKAITRYRRVAHARNVSLLEIDMETGVTHQIRAHCAGIGHPIVGDAVYGDLEAPAFGLERHFLHARGLTILQPANEKRLTIVAELPGELVELLRRLKIRA